MEIYKLIPYVYAQFNLFLLVMTRISTFFSVFIIFRSDYVNIRIILVLSILMSALLMNFQVVSSTQVIIFSSRFMLMMVMQVVIGFFLAIILNVIFEVFTAAAQIISTQIGLGMAAMFDPKLGQITGLTKFYNYVVILIFLSLNGHIFTIQILADSFQILKIENSAIHMATVFEVIQYTKSIFSGGMLLSLTVIVAVFLANLTLAMISRFSPQFNFFSMGIVFSLIIGIIFVYITFNLFIHQAIDYLQQGLNFYNHLLMTAG